MAPVVRSALGYRSSSRSSTESRRPFLADDGADVESKVYPDGDTYSWPQWTSRWWTGPIKGVATILRACFVVRCGSKRMRKPLRLLLSLLAALPYLIVALVVFTAVLRPSYTHRPAHYQSLSQRCAESSMPGRANVNNEKVFIATSIYDKEGILAGGAWGKSVLELVNLLGPENVFLSVYENDPDPLARSALDAFAKEVKCKSSIVTEHLSMDEIPHITSPIGEKLIKRIAFLAEVRNRALRPLDGPHSPLQVAQSVAKIPFDKILFINDVLFDPLDAAQLLFSTNMDESGRTNYRAACAVDFINPFKFYDTFATRDLEGYSTGIPFYPWFTAAGQAVTRQDVLDQRDAVRVRSCWGGMAAYEAKWFQVTDKRLEELAGDELAPAISLAPASGHETTDALRFRSEQDIFWDASECCLINADLQIPRRNTSDVASDSGIFMNPYIRVAYDERTLAWLPWTSRPERLYSIVHNILTRMVGRPGFNPRRTHEPGDEVVEVVWQQDGDDPSTGSFQEITRIASPGRYCGGRKLLALNENAADEEPRWMRVPIPGCTQDGGGCQVAVH